MQPPVFMTRTSVALGVLLVACAACGDDDPIALGAGGSGSCESGSGGVFAAGVTVGDSSSSTSNGGGQVGGAGGAGGDGGRAGGCAHCSEVLDGTATKDDLCASSEPLLDAIGVCVCGDDVTPGSCEVECANACTGMPPDQTCVDCVETQCAAERAACAAD